jgi:hypothetical protein
MNTTEERARAAPTVRRILAAIEGEHAIRGEWPWVAWLSKDVAETVRDNDGRLIGGVGIDADRATSGVGRIVHVREDAGLPPDTIVFTYENVKHPIPPTQRA